MQAGKAPTITTHRAEMPVLGYGTMLYPQPKRAVELISHAIEYGYRHIDTARKYGSEHWVGEAIAGSNVPRSSAPGIGASWTRQPAARYGTSADATRVTRR